MTINYSKFNIIHRHLEYYILRLLNINILNHDTHSGNTKFLLKQKNVFIVSCWWDDKLKILAISFVFEGGLAEENAKIAYGSVWKNIHVFFWDRKSRFLHFPSRVTGRIHRARRSYKITFLLPLLVLSPGLSFPSLLFSLAVNKERERKIARAFLLILGKFQWTHCGNPEGMEIRLVFGERRLKDRKTVKWVLRHAEYILTWILFRSFLSSL